MCNNIISSCFKSLLHRFQKVELVHHPRLEVAFGNLLLQLDLVVDSQKEDKRWRGWRRLQEGKTKLWTIVGNLMREGVAATFSGHRCYSKIYKSIFL